MARRRLTKHKSASAILQQGPQSRSRRHETVPEPSSTYENARTAASRAFHKLNSRSYSSIGARSAADMPRVTAHHRRSGAGSHFAQQRSEEMARLSRRPRSSDLQMPSRRSCGTPSTDAQPQHISFNLAGVDRHSADVQLNGYLPVPKEGETRQRSPDMHNMRKSRSLLGLNPLCQSERDDSAGRSSERTFQPTPTSGRGKAKEHSPIGRSEGSLLMRARDQYLQEEKTRTVRKRRSIIPVFARPLATKSSKAFSVKTGDSDMGNASYQAVSDEQRSRFSSRRAVSEKAKRVSQALKKKLSRVFALSPKRKQGLPTQQIDSPYIHFGSGNTTKFSNFSGCHFPETEVGEESEDLLSKSPPLDLDSSEFDNDAVLFPTTEAGIHMPGESRVTSWNDSSGKSTLDKPATLLSMVEEQTENTLSSKASATKAKAESSSSSRKFLVRRLGSKPNTSHGTDIRRLFSAVQRRIQQSSFEGSQIDVSELLDDIRENEDDQGALEERMAGDVNREPLGDHEPTRGLLGTWQPDPRDLVSPSVYSSRSDGDKFNILNNRAISSNMGSYREKGTAWIQENRSVLKHDLQSHSPTMPQAPVMTSNEWRDWTNTEFSGLEKQVSSLRLNTYQKTPRIPSDFSTSATAREYSNAYSNNEQHAANNDRFQLIDPGRESRRVAGGESPRTFKRGIPVSPPAETLEIASSRYDTGCNATTKRAEYNRIEPDRSQIHTFNNSSNSGNNLWRRWDRDRTSMEKASQARKSVDSVLAENVSPFLDDNVLRAIRRGPYASPSPVPTASSSDRDSPIKVRKRGNPYRGSENVSPRGADQSKPKNGDCENSKSGVDESWGQLPTSSPPAYV